MKVYRYYIILIVILVKSTLSAQVNTDSLKKIWNNKSLPDTSRLTALADFAWDGYLFSQPDSACYFFQLQYKMAMEMKEPVFAAIALKEQGTSFYVRGLFKEALELYNRALKEFKKLKSEKHISGTENNIGLIYREMGNHRLAIHYFMKSLRYDEKVKNYDGVATSYNNIGTIYVEQNDPDKGMSYFKKAYKLHLKSKNLDGASLCLNNIASIYINAGEYKTAISYNRKSMEMRLKLNNINALAQSYLNLGVCYHSVQQMDSSYYFLKESQRLYTEMQDLRGITATEYYFGEIELEKGNMKQAKKHLLLAYEYSRKVGDAYEYRFILDNLRKVYMAEGDYKSALKVYEDYIKNRDSVTSESNQKEIIRQEYKYQYEKKSIADSVANARQDEIRNAQIARQKADLKSKRFQQYLLYGGLALILIFALFMYNRFKVISKQKAEIELQKVLVEEKQKEILDSIRYAKRIQLAQLPTEKFIDRQMKKLNKK